MAEYLYDGTHDNLREMVAHHKAGEVILCAKCRSPLVVVLDLEAARKHGVSKGIYCPKDERHVDVTFHDRILK